MNPAVKESFHRKYRRVLGEVAKQLGLEKGRYKVRSNKGGFGILGDVTLHAERLYVKVGGSIVDPITTPKTDAYWCMYRSCKGLKDYIGGQNRWMGLDMFEPDRRDELLERLRAAQGAS